ncbi:MAG TPA: 2-phospho-L-lactate transferase [Candidatus Dormibacteraeota bacterium]|jgi:LPPG:FO 2-phospho-L-lactate transferase|nr:2-phospho-L-lactate transferase [Candidatus Dormibacteraeota bacterium]
MPAPRVVVLAGGVGAARFLEGVISALPQRELTIVGNVGDDVEVAGLHISPDLDTVLYTLTGAIDAARGWGVRGDSTRALERARWLGADAWFGLGDLDIGLHMARTQWLHEGLDLSAVTARLATAFGFHDRLLPCTNDQVRTLITTAQGVIDLQTYYVRNAHSDEVLGISFDGAGDARPAPGVLEAMSTADAILIAPSNPLISIGPILAVPAIRQALRARSVRCVAVTPIVGGRALRGPAADMLGALGHEASPVGVASIYAGLIDAMVIDDADAARADDVRRLGVEPFVTDTIMRDGAAKHHLAVSALGAAGIPVER